LTDRAFFCELFIAVVCYPLICDTVSFCDLGMKQRFIFNLCAAFHFKIPCDYLKSDVVLGTEDSSIKFERGSFALNCPLSCIHLARGGASPTVINRFSHFIWRCWFFLILVVIDACSSLLLANILKYSFE